MPRVLCVACGKDAEFIVRKDYDIKRGGMSLCTGCKPTRGVWAKCIADVDSVVVKPAVRVKGKVSQIRTKGRLTR